MTDPDMGTGRCGGAEPGRHLPVLLPEVLSSLGPIADGPYIDATFGAGGYTRSILESGQCNVWALDRDPSAIAGGRDLVSRFAPRLNLEEMAFGDLLACASARPELCGKFDGAVFDLGVSSMQLDDAQRGFSFLKDGPLDMRMFHANGDIAAGSDERPSAATVVNTTEQALLADILYQLGEERRSRAISAAIIKRRQEAPLTRTGELADLVVRVIGKRPGDKIHPATRTFQALRIYVNDELGELARGLAGAERLLAPGGRLVVVTFHSLEDRLVKRFLGARAGREGRTSRHLPQIESKLGPSFQILNHRAVTPTDEEIRRNPRARSAKLRAAIRTDAPAWPYDAREAGLPAVLRD